MKSLHIAAALTAGCAAAAPASDADLAGRVRQILAEVPLIDGHNDMPWQYRKRVNLSLDELDFGSDLSALDPPLCSDPWAAQLAAILRRHHRATKSRHCKSVSQTSNSQHPCLRFPLKGHFPTSTSA